MKALFTLLFTGLTYSIFAQGFTWTEQNSGVSNTLNDVYFTSIQMGWAVGINGTILNTTNGGQNWQQQTSGTNEPLASIFFANDTVGWIAGGSNNALLLHTTNGGQNWNPVSTGINSGPILDIAFASGSNVGYCITADSIYRSDNGGNSWASEPYTSVIGTAVNSSLSVLSPSEAFVGGRRFQTGIQDSSPEVYDRRDMGGSYAWGPSTLNQFANMDRMESIAFSNSSTGFAGGIQGKLYRMQATLPVVTGPWDVCLDLGAGNNQTINSISFVNDSTGIFSTPIQVGMNKYSLIYHTHNAGDNWSNPDTIDDFYLSKMQLVTPSAAWAVGTNGKIYAGTDGVNGIVAIEKESIRVYPNPASQYVQFDIPGISTNGTQIVVYSSLGAEVFRGILPPQMALNLENWPNGLYFFQLRTPENTVYSGKWVVTK
jgi:photosystem II stability/assembly factor-like uncharacterized protein